MLASTFLNRFFQVGWRRFASSSLSPLRFSLRKHRRSVSGRAGPRSFSVPARSSSLVPWDSRATGRREMVLGGNIKTSAVAEQRGFITGKPVSYANIDLQTLHYRWWAINTPACPLPGNANALWMSLNYTATLSAYELADRDWSEIFSSSSFSLIYVQSIAKWYER